MNKITLLLILIISFVKLNAQILSSTYTLGAQTTTNQISLINAVLNKNYSTMPSNSCSTPGNYSWNGTSSNGNNNFNLCYQYASSGCGVCGTGKHPGIDLYTCTGTPVYSPLSGVVTNTPQFCPTGCTGTVAVYNSTYQLTFCFIHLSSSPLSVGSIINVGDFIGLSGSTGASGAHLHLELRAGQKFSGASPCDALATQAIYDPHIIMDYFTGVPICPQPSNDYCSTPATLAPSTSCTYTQGTSCGATPPTNNLTSVCISNTPDDDVWYQFTATSTSHNITLQPITATFDGVIELMGGTCPSSLSNISCANATGAGSNETLSATGLTIGNTYLVRVYSAGSGVANTGSFNICVTTASQSYTVTTSSLPSNGGTTTGTNTYSSGQLVTVNATPNSGYTFINWTESSNVLSTFPSLSFNVNANRNLVANFSNCSYSLNTNSSGNLVANSTYNAFWIYTSVNCSWTATTSGCPWVTITNPTGTGSTLISCNLTANTSTSPRSCVITIAGQTYTITQVGYVPPCSTTPSPPNSLSTFYQSSNNIGLSWAGNIAGFTNFEIERATSITGPYTHIGDVIPPITNYFDITGTPGTTYYYRVRACCNSNCSSYSNIDSAVSCVWQVSATSVITSTDTVCVGSPITLTALGGNLGTGGNWTWYNNSAIVGTGLSITVNASIDSNYCVKPTNSTCPQPSTSPKCKKVVVKQQPVASTISATGSTTFCQGGNVTLTGNNGGTWNTNAISSSITTNTSGNYFVTNFNSCGSVTSNQINVTVNPLPNVTAGVDASICSGVPAYLGSATTSGVTYNWQPTTGLNNSTISDPVATVSSNTTYSLTATSANGCIGYDTVAISVAQTPTLIINTVPSSAIVCNTSTSVTLTASGSNSYSWTGGVTNGISFNPSSTTSYTVTGTDISGCSATASQTITVGNTNPVSIASIPANATVCIGSPLTLTASGSTSYSWTGGITNGVSFIPTNSTYTVTATDVVGCTTTATITAVVNPIPTVSITSTPTNGIVCTGDNATLNATGTAANYTWSGGITNNIPFMPLVSTTYTVTGTDASNCTVTSTIGLTVTPNTIPSVNLTSTSTSVSNGQYVSYQANVLPASIPNYILSWLVNDALISSTQFPIDTFGYVASNSTDTVCVRLIPLDGCYSPDTIMSNCLSIANVTSVTDVRFNSNIKVYPNPVDDKLNIELIDFQNTSIKLIDLFGNVVLTQNVKSNKTQIQTSSFAKGLYNLEIISNGKLYNKKVIIQ